METEDVGDVAGVQRIVPGLEHAPAAEALPFGEKLQGAHIIPQHHFPVAPLGVLENLHFSAEQSGDALIPGGGIVHLIAAEGDLVYRAGGLSHFQHPQTVGQNPVEPIGQILRQSVGGQVKIGQLTLALVAGGQRHQNGQIDMGIEPLGVPHRQFGPHQGPLEGVHQVQMGNIGGIFVFLKFDSHFKHHRASRRTESARRNSGIRRRSPVWRPP